MTSSPLGPDFARALADHTIVAGPISGMWTCIGPCEASSIDNVHRVGPHDEHENSETGAAWSTS